LKTHRDNHAPLKTALSELDTLLRESMSIAGSGGKVADHVKHLARLAAGGVDGLDVLTMAGAVFLADRDRAVTIKGPRPLAFAVARAVASLTPRRSMYLGSRACAALGACILDRYSGLLSAVVDRVEQDDETVRKRARWMASPLPPQQPQALA
jgi:hypothetical protein